MALLTPTICYDWSILVAVRLSVQYITLVLRLNSLWAHYLALQERGLCSWSHKLLGLMLWRLSPWMLLSLLLLWIGPTLADWFILSAWDSINATLRPWRNGCVLTRPDIPCRQGLFSCRRLCMMRNTIQWDLLNDKPSRHLRLVRSCVGAISLLHSIFRKQHLLRCLDVRNHCLLLLNLLTKC